MYGKMLLISQTEKVKHQQMRKKSLNFAEDIKVQLIFKINYYKVYVLYILIIKDSNI